MELNAVEINFAEARSTAMFYGRALHPLTWPVLIAHLLRCLLKQLATWHSAVLILAALLLPGHFFLFLFSYKCATLTSFPQLKLFINCLSLILFFFNPEVYCQGEFMKGLLLKSDGHCRWWSGTRARLLPCCCGPWHSLHCLPGDMGRLTWTHHSLS